MRLPPQDLKIGVCLLLDIYLTWLMGLSPQDLKIGVYLLLDSYLTWLMRLSPQKLPTHNGGDILDLVISRSDTQLVKDVSVVEGISEAF